MSEIKRWDDGTNAYWQKLKDRNNEMVESPKGIEFDCAEFVEGRSDIDPYDLAEAILNATRTIIAKVEGNA